MMLILSDAVQAAILRHAAAVAPQECCGLVIVQDGRQIYRACRNVAAAPAESFEIAAEGWDFKGDLAAIVHSHPQGEPYLSGADRAAMRQFNVPWVLAVAGSLKIFRPVLPLRGRGFVYGRYDCIGLIRDAYHLAGIELKDPPRRTIEQDEADDLLYRNAIPWGFLPAHELQAGDVVLIALGGNANHAALYLGDGQVLHHAYNHLSRRDAYGRFWQNHTHSIWRHQQWLPEMMAAIENDLHHAV